MNKKQLLLVLILGLVIGGAAYITLQKRQEDYTAPKARMGERLLGEFDVNAVAGLRIQQGSNSLNLVKTGDVWVVRERGDYPANFNTLADFVRKFADLKVAKPVEVGPSRLAALELVGPDKNGPGTLIEFKDAGGKTLKSLLLGAKHMRESRGNSPFGGDSSWPDGRYLMVDGKTDTVALVNDALTQAEPKPADWINKDFFKVEKLKTVSVVAAQPTNNWTLTRDTENGEWKLADAKPGEAADASKCSSLNYAFSAPTFNDVALDWTFNDTNKPTTTATLQTFDHFTYTVKLAPKEGDNYYLQVAVKADLPKERTPTGTNETAEVKEKLDKEFREKTDKLKDKLKTEQAFEKWTYVVSKWTVDAVLKERKDLVSEKKEEPKPAVSASPATNAPPAPSSPPPPKPAEPPKPAAVATTNAPATPPAPAPAPAASSAPKTEAPKKGASPTTNAPPPPPPPPPPSASKAKAADNARDK